MGRKKKSETEKSESQYVGMTDNGTMLKASEWAKCDPTHPDPHLFFWWDKDGVMTESRYLEIKKTVCKG